VFTGAPPPLKRQFPAPVGFVGENLRPEKLLLFFNLSLDNWWVWVYN